MSPPISPQVPNTGGGVLFRDTRSPVFYLLHHADQASFSPQTHIRVSLQDLSVYMHIHLSVRLPPQLVTCNRRM